MEAPNFLVWWRSDGSCVSSYVQMVEIVSIEIQTRAISYSGHDV
jgi:hypothetical protein